MTASEMLKREVGMDSPALDALPVTPSDGTDLTTPARALVIGTAGDLKVNTVAGNTRVLTGVPAGVLPLAVTRVWSTGTTAANISALL